PTPTAVGPRQLWPTLPPASAAAEDYGSGRTEVVKGLKVPQGDLHRVTPVAVVRAQAKAHPTVYKNVVAGLARCGEPGKKGPGCPVLDAYYADVTGDGKDDMIVGFKASKNQFVVQIYMYTDGRPVMIMEDEDSVISVRLAGRNLVVRAAADLPGYEYRTSWTYDRHQHAMLPTREDIVRTAAPPSAGVSPSASPLPEPPSVVPQSPSAASHAPASSSPASPSPSPSSP
ncbi:hypothetical protein, partial [Streptomyces beihaiensis]